MCSCFVHASSRPLCHLWPFCVNFWVNFSSLPNKRPVHSQHITYTPRYRHALCSSCNDDSVGRGEAAISGCTGDICMNIKSSCTAICDFASDIKRGTAHGLRRRGRVEKQHLLTSSFRAGASELAHNTTSIIKTDLQPPQTDTQRKRQRHYYDSRQRQHTTHCTLYLIASER